MYSIIEQDGFQYRVSEGDTLTVPRLDVEKDGEITIDNVLLVHNGDSVTVGNPYVRNAHVRAKVVDHEQGKKVLVIKKKRRKDYRRKNGHRRKTTRLRVMSISV